MMTNKFDNYFDWGQADTICSVRIMQQNYYKRLYM